MKSPTMQEELPALISESIEYTTERRIVFKDNKIVRCRKTAPMDFSDILPELKGILDKPVLDATFIRDLISADEICRGRDGSFVGWPVLDGDDIYRLHLELRLRSFDTYMPFASSVGRSNKQPLTFDPGLLDPEKASAKLLQRWPLIDEILHEGEGHLLLAGGSVCTAFFEQGASNSKDLDFYFIGFDRHDTAEADRLLEKLINFIQQKFIDGETLSQARQGHFDGKRFRVSRSSTVVTVVATIYSPDQNNANHEDGNLSRTYEIQFILRLYPKTGHLLTDISLPLGGFDLHSCAVGYYLHLETLQGVFYATTAGAFSLATKINIVVTSRFSPSMIFRLKKYKNRDFEILFPGTSKERQSRESIKNMLLWKIKAPFMEIHLPFMTVTEQTTKTYESHESDYAIGSDNGGYRQSNLIALMTGRSEQYCIIGDRWLDVLDEPKASFLKRKSITKLMEKLSKEHQRIIDPMYGMYSFNDHRRQIRSIFATIIGQDLLKSNFIFEQQNIQKLKQSLGAAHVIDITKEIDDDLTASSSGSRLDLLQLTLELSTAENDLKVKLRPLVEEKLIELCIANDVEFEKYLIAKEAEIFEMMTVAEERCLTQMKKRVKWNVTNPLTQHTASCNPTIVDPRAWYGKNKRGQDNYVPFRVGFPDEIFFILKCVFTGYGQEKGPNFYIGAMSVFKQLIVPYCAHAWAANVTERLVSVCRANYKLNSQYRYLDGVVKCTRTDGAMPYPTVRDGYVVGTTDIYAKLDVGDEEIVKMVLEQEVVDAENSLQQRFRRVAAVVGHMTGYPIDDDSEEYNSDEDEEFL